MISVRRTLTVLLALVLGVVLAPAPSASAALVDLGKVCAGGKAIRCAWVRHDTVNHRVRGYGSIHDTTSPPIGVRVSVTLQRYNYAIDRWEPVSSGGPVAAYDFAQAGTGLVTCGDGQLFRADVVWEWNGTDGGKISSSATKTTFC